MGQTPNLTRRRLLQAAGGLAAGAAGLAPGLVRGASRYPDRAITFICPWSVGGTADQSMRALCQAASRELGQSIVVENRAGAAGMIGLKQMASARPDGYTIGQIPISVTRFSQLGMVDVDPARDLTYLARTSGQTFGIAVPPNAPWKDLKALVADAKKRPGVITYGHSGVGGATHVGMEEFLLAAKARMMHVPYKGGADALQAVLGGHVDVLVDSSSWAPHVEAGRLRLLATWGAERTPRFKNVPTLKDEGYDVVVDAPNGVGAPAGLDPAVRDRLYDAFRKAVASDEFRQTCERIDAPVMYLSGPDYGKYVQEVYEKETRLIAALDLKSLMKR